MFDMGATGVARPVCTDPHINSLTGNGSMHINTHRWCETKLCRRCE